MNVNPDAVENHETWLMASFIFGDESDSDTWMQFAMMAKRNTEMSPHDAEKFVADKLKQHYTREGDKLFKGPGVFYDLVTMALGRIHWDQIAALLLDECIISDDA